VDQRRQRKAQTQALTGLATAGESVWFGVGKRATSGERPSRLVHLLEP